MLALSITLGRDDWIHIIMPNGDRLKITANHAKYDPNKVVIVFDAPLKYKILRSKLDKEVR